MLFSSPERSLSLIFRMGFPLRSSLFRNVNFRSTKATLESRRSSIKFFDKSKSCNNEARSQSVGFPHDFSKLDEIFSFVRNCSWSSGKVSSFMPARLSSKVSFGSERRVLADLDEIGLLEMSMFLTLIREPGGTSTRLLFERSKMTSVSPCSPTARSGKL